MVSEVTCTALEWPQVQFKQTFVIFPYSVVYWHSYLKGVFLNMIVDRQLSYSCPQRIIKHQTIISSKPNESSGINKKTQFNTVQVRAVDVVSF
jgi:hypothetical protein